MMTTAFHESRLYRLITFLWFALLDSRFYRLCTGVGRGIAVAFQNSVLCNALVRPGLVTRAWEDSTLCRLLDKVANCIPAALHRLYLRTQPAWDGSVVFRILAGMGENVPAILSWLFLLMMVCPYTNWNNLYGLAVALLALVLCFSGAMRRDSLRLNVKAFSPYMWFFFLFLIVGVLESSDIMISVRYLLYFVTAILLALLVASTVERIDQLKRLAAFGAAGLPVATAYGVYQRVVLGLTNSSLTVDLTVNPDLPGRVYSFFDNANTFAQVLVMMLGMTLGLLFASRTVWGKIAALVALVSGLVGIAMTYSRASWVGLIVAVFLFVLLAAPRLIPALILVAAAMLPFLPASIYNRLLTIFNSSDSSTVSRFPIYEVGFKMWKLYPLTGVGLGSELSAAKALNSGWYHGYFDFPHYHNIYIQLAVETGALGLLSYLGGFLAACKATIRAALAADCPHPVKYLAIGCFSGLAGMMVCGLADYFWHYPRVMAIFWLIFGIMVACVRLARVEENGERNAAELS
jgi:O-antigen ligase